MGEKCRCPNTSEIYPHKFHHIPVANWPMPIEWQFYRIFFFQAKKCLEPETCFVRPKWLHWYFGFGQRTSDASSLQFTVVGARCSGQRIPNVVAQTKNAVQITVPSAPADEMEGNAKAYQIFVRIHESKDQNRSIEYMRKKHVRLSFQCAFSI